MKHGKNRSRIPCGTEKRREHGQAVNGSCRLSVLLCAVLLCSGLLAACGRQGGQESQQAAEEQASVVEPEAEPEIPKEPTDWNRGGYEMPRTMVGDLDWRCLDSCRLETPEPDFSYVEAKVVFDSCDSLGSDFYVLREYDLGEEENGRYRLYWLDGETRESHCAVPFWEETHPELRIGGISAVGDHQLALYGVSFGETRQTFLLRWDLDSGEGSILELTQAEAQVGEWHMFWADRDGYVYLTGYPDAAGVYILGEGETPGQAELLRTLPAEMGKESPVYLYCRLPDGTPLMCLDKKVLHVDMDSGEVKELATLTNYTYQTGCVNDSGAIYMMWGTQAVLWDAAAGELNCIAELKGYGYNYQGKHACIGVDEAGNLMAMTEKDGQIDILYFGPKDETEGTLRLANLWYNNGDVGEAAAAYSMAHPDCRIAYEADWENNEGFCQRIMAQMTAGDGPDLLFVHAEDMERLNGKKLLADLSDVLEEETRRQLFAGILTAGERNGRLAGLPAGINGVSMITTDGNWQKESWTLPEAVELWGQRRGQGAWRFLPERWSQQEMLEYMVLTELANSPFIDWENHTCDFESDLFRQVLEMIAERPVREHTNLDIEEEYETAAKVADGVYLADVIYGGGLSVYACLMEYYRGEARLVGLPAGNGSGNVLKCYGFLVVNAKSEHLEEAMDFLGFYYGKEFQSGVQSNVLRKDVLRERVVPCEGDKESEIDTATNVIVPLKKDGTSYVEDYIAFMDSCRAELLGTEAVRAIIQEEAESYFERVQTVEQTVRNIQNRVQLYLEENK